VVPRTLDEAGLLFSNLSSQAQPPKRWVALVPPGRPGREISTDLNQAAALAGCVLAKVFEFTLTNRTATLTQIVKTNADAVLVWLDPQSAGACVRLLRLAGFSGVLAGPTQLQTPGFVEAAGNALDGFVLPGLRLDGPSLARFQAFQAVFRHQQKREPDITAAFSFDASALLIHLLRTTDADALPRAFPLDLNIEGVCGPLSFDAEGNRKIALQLLQAEKGVFAPLGDNSRN
jgi:ABC-type branched-subunit amino acid transport system substrate-binding protein